MTDAKVAVLAMSLCASIATLVFNHFMHKEHKAEIERLRRENWLLRQMVGADEEDLDDGDRYVI